MGIMEDYAAIRGRMEGVINQALGDGVAEGLKRAIAQQAESAVYKYPPKFEHRRKENGGIIDPGNMIVSVGNLEMTLDNATRLQNLFGGNDTSPLVPIIEEGVAVYHMPKPREFMDDARDEYVRSGDAGREIAQALMSAGFEMI